MLRLPAFTPFFPTTLSEALRRKAESPESSFVAGGTDLYPNMKRRQQTPAVVVDVRGISELARLYRDTEGQL